jgi:hypothetical protein
MYTMAHICHTVSPSTSHVVRKVSAISKPAGYCRSSEACWQEGMVRPPVVFTYGRGLHI